MEKSDIAVIGLGNMGYNLAINIAQKGYAVTVFDIDGQKVKDIVRAEQGRGSYQGVSTLKETVFSLKKPRKILLMIKAGKPVDDVLMGLKNYLDQGDIIIDGGNSYFKDTQRRQEELEREKVFIIGAGISGGKEGALKGPSIMPGGDKRAYRHVQNIFEDIAAKASDGKPCVSYKGRFGSGHYIKMVHNGIEYADMQLIGECFWLLNHRLGGNLGEVQKIFEKWNKKGDPLRSYLVEITAEILKKEDKSDNSLLIHKIADYTRMKGTGTWTVISALEQLIPVPTIASAVFSREFSEIKDVRTKVAGEIGIKRTANGVGKDDIEKFIVSAHDSLLACKAAAYSQGLSLIADASTRYDYGIELKGVIEDWREGCILKADILDEIINWLEKKGKGENHIIRCFSKLLSNTIGALDYLIESARVAGIPVPCMASSYFYILQYANKELFSSKLTSVQRDYFGSHGYYRLGKDGKDIIKDATGNPKKFHTHWE